MSKTYSGLIAAVVCLMTACVLYALGGFWFSGFTAGWAAAFLTGTLLVAAEAKS